MNENHGVSTGVLGKIQPEGFVGRTRKILELREALDLYDPANSPHHLELLIRRPEELNPMLTMLKDGLGSSLNELIRKNVSVSVHAPGYEYGINGQEDDRILGPLRDLYQAVPGLQSLVFHAEWFDIDTLDLICHWQLPIALEGSDFRWPQWTTPESYKQMSQVAPAGVVIDIGHVESANSEIDALKKILDAIPDKRISHFHTSIVSGPNGAHSPLSLNQNDHLVVEQVKYAHLNGQVKISESPLPVTLGSQTLESMAAFMIKEFAQLS